PALIAFPSPLAGEGGAQRRMRGSLGYRGRGGNPSPALHAPSPSGGEGNGTVLAERYWTSYPAALIAATPASDLRNARKSLAAWLSAPCLSSPAFCLIAG